MAGGVRGNRVLDVGCASGGLSEAFVERGASVVGLDLNPRLIERARGRLGSRAELQVVGSGSGAFPAARTRAASVRSENRR
jgi:SAM-dependent methyltransferase